MTAGGDVISLLSSQPQEGEECTRAVTRIEASPARLDEMTRQFQERTVPVLDGLEGYKGYVLLGDRGNGAAMAVTYWESEDAMRASEDAVTEERERAAETAEATAGPTVERYEVVSAS